MRSGGDDASMIRVLIVDDHAVVRAGLRMLLEREDDIEVVAEAGSARDAIFALRTVTDVDVIVLDLVMPEMSGIEAMPKLMAEAPGARVLVLSMQDDPAYVQQAFAAGATGYLPKEAVDTVILTAVREFAAGRRYLHPLLGARLAQSDAKARDAAAADPLSDREHEVLHLLARGHTNQEIASTLYISVRTAETHRAHIMQKLRLGTRAEIVAYAIDHGLLV